MSKRCPDCRRVNEDSRIFCGYCGAALDAQVRLIQDLEKQKEQTSKPSSSRERGDVNFYVSRRAPQPKKSSPAPWIFLGLLAVAVILWFLFK